MLFPSDLGRYALRFLSESTRLDRVPPVDAVARVKNHLERDVRAIEKCARKGCDRDRAPGKILCGSCGAVVMTDTLDNIRVIPPASPMSVPDTEAARRYFDDRMKRVG